MRVARFAALLLLPWLGACAFGPDVVGTEQMLAASGFAMQPANTPERAAELAALPPHQLVLRAGPSPGAPPTYVYADPSHCRCLFVGNPQNYQYFQQLAVQRQIADQNLMAAQMNESAALNWSLRPPPVVIIHRHH